MQEFKTKELLDIINKVLPGTSSKNIVEELGQIVVCDDTMMSYNDKIAIMHPISAKIEFSVSAIDFYAAIKNIRNKTLKLTLNSNVLFVSAGKTEIKLPSAKTNAVITKMMDTLCIEDLEFEELPENFLKGLKIAELTSSDNMDDVSGLYAICIDDGYIFSADKFKISKFKLSEEMEASFFIQKTFVQTITNFKPDGWAQEGNFVFFINSEDAILACKTADVSEIYPLKQLKKFFNEIEENATIFSFEEGIKEELNTFIYFNKDEVVDKSVDVAISEEGIATFTSTSQKGEVSREFKVKGWENSEEINFAVNPKFLQNIIEKDSEFYFDKKQLVMTTNELQHKLSLKI